MIAEGRVQVNKQIATLGMQADQDVDDVRVDGVRLRDPQAPVYVMLNKPPGVISDEDVAGNWPRARDLIPMQGHLYPVGRLDLHSEGLMLFTNDGELAHRLTHPRFEHTKCYLVTVEGSPSEKTLDAWRRGVILDDRRTAPAEVIRIRKNKLGVVLKITIREGRKRQLRRVAALLGHPARRLQRIRLASLELGNLAEGSWRVLTKDEIDALRSEVARRRARKPRAARDPGEPRSTSVHKPRTRLRSSAKPGRRRP